METFITILVILFCVLLIYYVGGIAVIVDDYVNSKKYTEAGLWRVCKRLTSEERQLYQKIYDIIKNTDVKDWDITIPSSMYDPIIYDIDKKIRLIINYDGSEYESQRIVIYVNPKKAVCWGYVPTECPDCHRRIPKFILREAMNIALFVEHYEDAKEEYAKFIKQQNKKKGTTK